MKITVRQLRQSIRRMLEHGLDTDMRNMAGSFMAGGVSSSHRDREASLMDPPPGLGSPEQQTDEPEDDEQQTKSQLGARVLDRTDPGRQA